MLSADCYWRQFLTVAGKKTYDSMLLALSQNRDSANAYLLDQKELSKTLVAFNCDHPEFFWLNPNLSLTTNGGIPSRFGGGRFAKRFGVILNRARPSVENGQEDDQSMPVVGRINLTRIYDYDVVQNAQAEIASVARKVKGKTALETITKILEHICNTATYAVDMTYNQNMASALYFKEAQCSGFAAAFNRLCNLNNVWCITVTGTARGSSMANGPHAWNIVCLNGKYYHVDPTFMLGSNLDKPSKLRYVYVNYTDSQMSATHTWDRNSVPKCDVHFSTSGQAGKTGNEQIDERFDSLEFSNLSQLRQALEKAILENKESLRFSLKVGSTPEEKNALVTSSMRMVLAKVRVSLSVDIETLGGIITVQFKKR